MEHDVSKEVKRDIKKLREEIGKTDIDTIVEEGWSVERLVGIVHGLDMAENILCTHEKAKRK